MAKESVRHKHDPTIAHHLLIRISTHTLSSTLTQHLEIETASFLRALKKLDEKGNGNDMEAVLWLVRDFKTSCDNIECAEKQHINDYFSNIISEIESTKKHSESHSVPINSAVEGYTLNRTSILIDALKDYIDDQSSKKHRTSFLTRDSLSKRPQFAFSTSKENRERLASELQVAENLLDSCKKIRGEIGSPDAMPKGHAINLMHHLCQATRQLNELYSDSYKLSERMVQIINTEIELLRELFPEEAKDGEKLEKAFAENPRPKG